MSTVSGSFTALNQVSSTVSLDAAGAVQVALTGTFVGDCRLQRSEGGGSVWSDAGPFVFGTESTVPGAGTYRLACSRLLSGTMNYVLTTDAVSQTPPQVIVQKTWVPSDISGVSNMAAELEAFVAANPGYTVTVPDNAIILLNNAFKLVTTGDILLDFGNATILYDHNTLNDAAVFADNTANAGAEKSVASLAIATVNDDATVTQITLNATAAGSRFDWFAIYSTNANPAKSGGQLGEIFQLLSDESSLVLTAARKLNMHASYSTGLNVRKLDATRKLRIRGGRWKANGNTQDHAITTRCKGIRIQGFVDPVVERVLFDHPWAQCVHFQCCAAPKWDRFELRDVGNLGTYNGFIYGAVLYAMNDQACGTNTEVRNGRHPAFTTDGNSSGSSTWYNKGIPTNFVVDGVHGYNCHGSIVDTHEEGDGGHIKNVSGYYSYQDEDITPNFTGVVIQLRCSRTRISNFHCYGGTSGVKVTAVEHGFEDPVYLDYVHVQGTTQGAAADSDIGINIADQSALTNKRHVYLNNATFDDVGKCVFLGKTAKLTCGDITARRIDTWVDHNEGSVFLATGTVALDYRGSTRTAPYFASDVRSGVTYGGATVIYMRKPIVIKGDAANKPTAFFEEHDTTANKSVYAPGLIEYNPSAVTATALYKSGATTFVRPAGLTESSTAPFVEVFNGRADATVTLTAMPAADNFFPVNSKRTVRKLDLSNYSQVRMVGNVFVGATASGKLVARYAPTFVLASAVATDFIDLGATEASISVVTAGVLVTSWIDIAPAAKADVFLAIIQTAGDGASNPGMGSLSLQFR